MALGTSDPLLEFFPSKAQRSRGPRPKFSKNLVEKTRNRERLDDLTVTIQTLGEYQILVVRTKEEAEELRRKVEAGGNLAGLAARHSIEPVASELREQLRAELDRIGVGQVSAVFPLAGNWAIVKKISAPSPARE